MTTKRPLGVTIIAIMMWIAATLAFFVCFLLFFPGTPLDRVWSLNSAAHDALAHPAPVRAAILLLVAGLVSAAAGLGLLRGRRWAWLLSVAIFGINALGDLVNLAITRDWMQSSAGIVIDALFLILLLLPRVRDHFALSA